jgi:hypothetical protein
MPRVLNKHYDDIPADAVWIMRPSKWGNPYHVKTYGRERCIELYKRYLLRSKLFYDVHELRGKDLVCCCKPAACHGDVLLELANRPVD